MVSELLIDPDVETVIIDYLNEWLPLLSGETGIASDKVHDVRCVRVIQTGGFGTVSRVLGRYLLTCDSYDVTEQRSSEFARRVAALIRNLEGSVYSSVVFSAVSEAGAAANLPDPLDDRPRYTQTFGISARLQSFTV